jgi:tetratricopeptide (TPR) repeat protein
MEKKQIDLVKESICVYEKCMECRGLFKAGQLGFTSIEDFVDDRGKSCLYRLKEMCHELYRNSDDASYKEKLYDITVGYIFHEAMKMRENLYQLEYYKPYCDIAVHDLTEKEKKIVHDINIMIKKADIRLREGLKETRTLLNELVEQLRDLIVAYRGNYLLPRFIFENERSLVRIYGKKGFKELLGMMYADGRLLLYFNAAQSYLESEYYDLARKLFQKIIRLDSKNRETLFLYRYASAFNFYFKNMFTKAMMFAENALSMDMDDTMKKPYRETLQKLLTDLKGEVKKKKKESERRG